MTYGVGDRPIIIDHDFKPLQDGVQLGSMIHFRKLFDRLLPAASPKVICEIGIEGGIVSDFLIERARFLGARYVGIDPFLAEEVAARLEGQGVELLRRRSLEALADLPCPDVTVIDGDHNHYTVLGELRLLRDAWTSANEPQTLILMHDTAWPCARRDCYYDASAIPAEHRQPLASDVGFSILSELLTPHGFGRGENFAIAAKTGGSRNGVLTALEDFLQETPAFAALHVPGVCGLSIVYPPQAISDPLRAALDELRQGLALFDELLSQLEYNRLFAYDLFRQVHFAPRPDKTGSPPPAKRLLDSLRRQARWIERRVRGAARPGRPGRPSESGPR